MPISFFKLLFPSRKAGNAPDVSPGTRDALRSLQDTYFLIDADNTLAQVSDSVHSLIGYSPKDVVGRPLTDLLVSDDANKDYRRMLDDSGGKVTDLELPLRHRGGSVVWVSVNAQRVFDEHKRVVGIEGTARNITAKRMTDDLRLRFGRLLDQSLHEIYAFDALTLRFTMVNHGALKNLGYTRAELMQMTPYDIKPKYTRDRFYELIQPLFEGVERELIYETIHRRKDGTDYFVEVRMQLYDDEQPPVFIAMAQDITGRKRAESNMRTLSQALEQTADSVLITDRDGVIDYVNPAFERVTGYSREEAIGQTPNMVKSGKHDKKFYETLWSVIQNGGVFRDVFINRAKDGHIYYEEKTITPLLDAAGRITHYISNGKDITERIETQERLYYLAHHDVVTDLPNRILFLDRLQHVVQSLARRDQICAVLFLDLDRFKNINDTLGHDIGDRLLRAVGERLMESVRAGDTVARLGGDEFTVLLEDVNTVDDVAPITRKILKSLTEPFHINEHELFTSASIGISLCPNDGSDPKVLLKNADTAMYRAKEQGRNNSQYYSAEMGERALEHLNLEMGLRHALERDEFELYFQPQIDRKRGTCFGAEVLLRWHHPELGLISPDDFIPLLEDTALIVPVGEWVLRRSCEQLNAWRSQGVDIERISINLSGRQFDALDFLDSVSGILDETGVDPRMLEFEITESLLLQRDQYTVDVLEQFNRRGIRIAIDDFGTGYSSLSYLKRFPIDSIKIDRTFVRDVPGNQEDAEIVKAILAMARSLHIDAIAEGVETVEQEAFLLEAGCELMQGHLYGGPAAHAQFLENYLARRRATSPMAADADSGAGRR